MVDAGRQAMHSYYLRDRTGMKSTSAQIFEFPDYDVMGELKMRICEHLDRSECVIAEKQTAGDTREETRASGKPSSNHQSASMFGVNGAPSYFLGEDLTVLESNNDEPAGQRRLNHRDVDVEAANEVINLVKVVFIFE